MSIVFNKATLIFNLKRVVKVTAEIITISIIIAVLPGFATAQTKEDSATVIAFADSYRSTWNTHESSAVGEFFTKDADFVMGNLPAVQGREIIRKWWLHYFARQEPERRLTIVINSIRRLSSDALLTNVTTTTGGQNSRGEELAKRRARGTWLLHKLEGKWFITAMQGMPTEEDSVILKASPEAAKVLMPKIRVFVDAYESAFNHHDPEAMSAFFTNNADIIIRNSSLIRGSEAIKEWWHDYFSEPKPYRALFIIDGIRMIDSDVALLNIVATGVPQSTETEEISLRYARGTWILVKEAGNWLIAALRVLPSQDDHILRKSY